MGSTVFALCFCVCLFFNRVIQHIDDAGKSRNHGEQNCTAQSLIKQNCADKETEPLTGSTVTSFRFRLLDGTNYEIIYNAEGVKSGRVQLGEETKDYFTSADIGSLWENCQEEAVKVDEAELPAYP